MTRPLDDLLNMDLEEISFENEYMIEGEITEDISLLYNKDLKKYFIHSFDQSTLDEYDIDIEDINNFEDIVIDGVIVTKEDFNNFKELVESL